jgi:endonuclease YncB( thermonuclease family)
LPAPAGTAHLPGWARILLSVTLAALVAGMPASGARGAGDRLAGPLPAQVVSVLDGDTLEVRIHIWLGQELRTRVRLAGIDAPELKGKCERERDLARRARAYLLARLDPVEAGDRAAAGAVRLREIRYGKYAGRVLARVETLDGMDLGQRLIAAGLARPYDGGRRASWCEATGSAGSG